MKLNSKPGLFRSWPTLITASLAYLAAMFYAGQVIRWIIQISY